MSIARKINLLIAAVAVLAGLALTVFVGLRDYSYQRDALLMEATTLVGSQPNLQLTLYFRDPVDINRTLDQLLALSPAVKHVRLFGSQGEVIGEQHQSWANAEETPPFTDVRRGLAPAEQGVINAPGRSVPPQLQWLRELTLGERSLSLTLPVISVVNQAQRGLQREDFAAAIAYPELVRSLHVAGYVDVVLSRTVLWSLTLPTVALSAGIGLAVVTLLWFLVRLITRRITEPLGMLAAMADDIAAGRHTQPLRVRGSGEVKHIAEVLNGVITGLHQYTRQMDTDRKILSMKIDERTEQLSKQQHQLSKARQTANEARDKLRHLAYFDTLTALPNRRLFTEQLTLLLRLAKRGQHKVGLLLIDIDNFKRINDSLGAAAGDALLKEVSERLAAGVRDSDILHRHGDGESAVMDLSRMGGDEFTVVLNQVDDSAAAQRVAERLAAAIARPFQLKHQEVIVTCSIGISIAPEQAATVEDLLRTASTAMMTAKKHGRNRALIYDESMDESDRERLQLENDLRRAAAGNQLFLHYQPQVHGRTGEVSGVECLVRWNHPEHGLIPPAKWIPIAEELGLINEIGSWVLREACVRMMELRSLGLVLRKISVNVSALQFRDEFIEEVARVLEETGLPAQCLELELTEGIMINDQDTTVAMVQQLKELGCLLSIDDFGTGYSSLSYLTRLPLDELKIDRSFVIGLADGRQNVELVRTIIAMAKSLELEIVVEGVERPEELVFFREQEVDTIQGFLFSPPVPMAQLENLLQPGHFETQLRRLESALAGTESDSDPGNGISMEPA